VVDSENPTVTCASPNATYDADPGVCDYTVTGTDLDPTATGDNCSIASVVNDFNNSPTLQGAVFPLETTTVIWTITDGSGNQTTCQYDVVVVDSENPTITCAIPAADYDADAGVCTYTVTGTDLDPTATGDNCSIASVVNDFNGSSTLQGAVFPLGTTTVTWTITDGSGNIATCTYDVVVVDSENPTITCAAPAATYDADPGICDYTVTGTDLDPTATGDNCTVASVVNNYNNSSTLQGAVFPLGTTTVIWTVTDGSGNTTTCQYDVIVVDSENPAIACASDGSRIIDQPNATYEIQGIEFDPTGVSDNCSVIGNITITHNAGVIIGALAGPNNVTLDGWQLPEGVHQVTFTAEDEAGNTSDCVVEITVETMVLEGSISANPNCTPLDMRVLVYQQGTSVLAGSFVTTIDNNGEFSLGLSGVGTGTYDVFFKVEKYLQKGALNVNISGTGTSVNVSGIIPGDVAGGGPAFNDNIVNSLDLSLILVAYNTLTGNPNFNP